MHDSRSILAQDLSAGGQHVRAGAFARAVPHFHAAAWTASRAGLARQRLDAQHRLADAQLQAREFHAAVASYRFAEQLAEAVVPDSAEYWIVRASLAQALRRTGQLDAARQECAAVRARLAQGALAPPDGRERLVGHMTASLQAQLDAMSGNFRAAAEGAVELADRFAAEHDGTHAADQLYNAALWMLLSCEQAGSAWSVPHERALSIIERASVLMRDEGRSADDDRQVDIELLSVGADLMYAKLSRRDGHGAVADGALSRAGERLDRIRAAHQDLPASLRFQIAVLCLRLAEQVPRAVDVDRCRLDIRQLLIAHRHVAELWARQDLGARFHWERDVVPLAQTDPDLERMLAEAVQ